ncbi:YqaJ viral recombinase family protein [Paenibacillus humicus]|uniref:YqaJ viral recombinase family nuclease n=1 Tax=Paenibacillus humicus TaxID=412861 RepID=UPI003F17DD0C
MAMTVAAITKGMERAEWLKLRKAGIGGSDAAAVAGMNPWKSPVGVYLEKTGQIVSPEAGEAAYWGNQLEDVVAREFATRSGFKIQRSNKLYRHKDHPFMLGNVDRLITDGSKRRGILEVKTTNAWASADWEDGKIPDHYAIQLQHYMAVLGLDYGFFAVLIGGNRFEQRYVERDETVIKALIGIEREFWEENVLKGVPPAVDGSGASTDLLNYMYPTSRPEHVIQLGAKDELLIQELRAAEAAAKAADLRLEAAKNAMKSEMQDAEAALFNGEKVVSWKSSSRTALDTKAVKAELPEIFEKYSRTSSSRRFLIH